ncbi:alpha/beta fold hydrolase [Collimonas fungivorans]|uniref:Putative hydrolase n=1 Tax=Collimonas fungivorans (strain Ter331) TaxID=1005048 RepID=G0AIX5_COLFT|nr:alpha/beta hydrolase [Collimonas fungivorans]AEK60908.1 putative hydrolase [Collimonas fungivorans Ter331]
MSTPAEQLAPTPESVAKAFLTPRTYERAPDTAGFQGASRVETNGPTGKLVSWQAGRGPIVLLVHGWEGRSSDMASFTPPLLAAGYRVVLVDLPAHGESEGTTSSIPACAAALLKLQDLIGPVYAAIAHSVGCALTVEAVRHGLQVERLVLIAPPARCFDYAVGFGVQAGLDRHQVAAMIALLQEQGVDVADIDTPKAAANLKQPVLILHSNDDRVVPVSLGVEIANAWQGAQLLRLDGLGHRRILQAPEVIEAARSFLMARTAVA